MGMSEHGFASCTVAHIDRSAFERSETQLGCTTTLGVLKHPLFMNEHVFHLGDNEPWMGISKYEIELDIVQCNGRTLIIFVFAVIVDL